LIKGKAEKIQATNLSL